MPWGPACRKQLPAIMPLLTPTDAGKGQESHTPVAKGCLTFPGWQRSEAIQMTDPIAPRMGHEEQQHKLSTFRFLGNRLSNKQETILLKFRP